MRLGPEAMEALRSEVPGRLIPGDDLVAAGPVGLSGTLLLLEKEYKNLRQYFSENFLWQAGRCLELYGADPEEEQAPEGMDIQNPAADRITVDRKNPGKPENRDTDADFSEIHCRYPLGEGGILAALWKAAEASGTGLRIDLRAIPIRQETIEICERLDVDPYRLESGGSTLYSTPDGQAVLRHYRRLGIPVALIGQAVPGNDRLLFSGSIVRCLDRPK